MYEKCFGIVQVARGNESATPLVLLHDGGGTVISYHALGPLNRDVYALSNPRFDDGRPWEGGIHEMAKVYAQLIKSRIRGDVLLGGWSFGGFLAFEIAHLLAKDDEINVTGLVLIDTPYPELTSTKTRAAVMHLPDLPSVRPQLRRKIYASLQQSKTMVVSWQPPVWEECASCQGCQPCSEVVKPTTGKALPRKHRQDPPPAVLLRADKYLPKHKGQMDAVALVDLSRKDPMLGWNSYETRFIQTVWDVQGDHHSIFNPSNVEHITEKIYSACDYLCRETMN